MAANGLGLMLPPRRMGTAARLTVAIAIASTALLLLGGSTARGGWGSYWLNYIGPGGAYPQGSIWAGGFTNNYGDKMFNTDISTGPHVHVMEHKVDGSWPYSVGGVGNITICHPLVYSTAGCWNDSAGFTEVADCDRLTGGPC